MANNTQQEDLQTILKFLHGSGQLDGYWFGDTPTDRPKYWWRPKLLDAITRLEAECTRREQALLDDLEDKIIPYYLEETDDEITVIPVHKVMKFIAELKRQLEGEQ